MKRLVLPFLATGLLTACGVGAVHPVFTDAETVFDSTLLGTWRDSSSREQAVISRSGPTAYDIRFTEEDGNSAPFKGTLGRIDGLVVMDVQPAPLPSSYADAYRDLVLRLHTFIVLDPRRDRLRFTMFDLDSLRAYLGREPGALAHFVTADGMVVLTAPTIELQRFLSAYHKRPRVLMDTIVWQRVGPAR